MTYVPFRSLNDVDVLAGIWQNFTQGLLIKEDSLAEIQSYVDGRIDSFKTTDGSPVLCLYHKEPAYFLDSGAEKVESYINFLTRNGYDLNERNSQGFTPLHIYCQALGEQSIIFMRTFLKLGADPHLVDIHGYNAIHLALSSRLLWEDQDGTPEHLAILEEKLTVLIKAGTDINLRTYDGDTPSIFARGFSSWNSWCRALEQTGKAIEDVVREEGNAWLLEDGWKKLMIDAGWDDRYFEIGLAEKNDEERRG
ncbi:hypothetical protein N0V90_006340 [Kalmusia sp. IMI 367209]|nr:hypothetical protein N0V90_006340 [Kalmusia sp. IMI 367209]